jgi:hypothetical protein
MPAAVLFVLLAAAGPAVGQPQLPGNALPQPRLSSVMPCGGKAGTSIEVVCSGTDLEEPQGLLFSHPGFRAEPIAEPPPPPADPKKAETKARPRRQQAPVMTSRFKVTIAPDTPPGLHDVRLVNKWGVSNARAFAVGDLLEVAEKEPNNDVPQAQRVEINTTISGSIAAPTDVDYYAFAGKKGQRVVVSCLASSIDSRLHPALHLYDAAGRQLAYNRQYSGSDAVLDCTLPADGDYHVRVCEFAHTQGSPEHFYRLSISTAPWIDAVFPPMVLPGQSAAVTVYGRNLPGGVPDPSAVLDGRPLEKVTVTVTAPSDPVQQQRLAFSGRVAPSAAALDGFELRLRNAAGTSNPFLLTYARAPVVLDNGAHDKPASAQEISLPCEIAGRIEKRRDRDWYAFTAKKGEVYTIEALSERLGSPTDIYFALRRPDTKQDLVEFDDTAETLSPFKFFTRSEDPPVYRFAVAADGKYQLLVASRDADTRAGPNLYYKVRITPERPDFHVIVIPPDDQRPDCCSVHQGGSQFVTAMVWRHEGWNGPVTLTAEGLPAGVACPTQTIGPGMRQAALVFTAAADAPAWTGEIRVKATGTVQGQPVQREARPASITWAVPQQGVPTISRLERNLVLAVRDKGPFGLAVTLDKPIVTQGTKVTAALKLARHWPDFKTPVVVTALDPPPNVVFNNNNQPKTLAAGKDDDTVVFDVRPNATPGTYNVVLRCQAPVPFNKDPMAKQKQPLNVVLPSNPVTLTVLPAQVATVSVGNAAPTVKVGAQAELIVKLTRLHDYAGEFKVQLVLPPNVKGVAADEVTIPTGKSEAKLVLKAAEDAAPGNRANLIVRAVATLAPNVTATQETKISVNVVK